jgi:cell wall-associated NlpC family hydrolase
VRRRQYLRITAADQRRVIGELHEAREDLTAMRGRLAAEELVGLVAAEQARREADTGGPAPPAAAARPAPKGAAAKPAAPIGPPPPVGKGAAAAVEEAKRQIGKPYVYGGSGPNSFDCSGLTAWAWRAAGVRLSHSAAAQYHETARVPVDAAQPGDLLFFGPSVSGIHHNAIYVGGGQMIEASQTGVPVRYRGWRAKDLVGVGRPG